MTNQDPKAIVVGIEHVDVLAQFSQDNLSKSYKHALDSGNIKVVCGDGREGFKECAPYDVINVGAYSD